MPSSYKQINLFIDYSLYNKILSSQAKPGTQFSLITILNINSKLSLELLPQQIIFLSNLTIPGNTSNKPLTLDPLFSLDFRWNFNENIPLNFQPPEALLSLKTEICLSEAFFEVCDLGSEIFYELLSWPSFGLFWKKWQKRQNVQKWVPPLCRKGFRANKKFFVIFLRRYFFSCNRLLEISN